MNFKEVINLQACKSADCMQVWLSKNHTPFDYLLVTKKNILLSNSLKANEHFATIYEDDVMVLLAPK